MHFESSHSQQHATISGFRIPTLDGHVCKSRECKTRFILHKVAPLPSPFGGCSPVSSWNLERRVCQPTLVSHFPMAAQVEGDPTGGVPPSSSLLGFCHMVAPVNKVVQARSKVSPISISPPQNGMFANCWGECLPKPKWLLTCLIVSGSFWNNNRCKLKTSICTWQG